MKILFSMFKDDKTFKFAPIVKVCTLFQGRRNERKSGPANAYVTRGGVWGGAPVFFFFWFCFVRFGAKYA